MAAMTVVAEPSKQEIVLSRTFNFPRELVFKAFVDPSLISQWWGPRYLTTEVTKMEPHSGGSWRFVQHDPNGSEYAFHGVYHSIVPNERTVSTFEFEGMPGHVVLETVIFEENNGKTTVTNISVFQSVADRDGMLESGMEEGTRESWDRFEELLAKM